MDKTGEGGVSLNEYCVLRVVVANTENFAWLVLTRALTISYKAR
jgi:hypothetical protein